MEDLTNTVTDGITLTTNVNTGDDVTTEPTETVETKQPTKQDIMRELSKEYGMNLFDVEGLQQFKEYQDSQKTEQQKLQEQLKALNDEKAQWESSKLEYESKLKASELGIKAEYLEDALKLADNDPAKLAEVIKKYPSFKTTGDVRIGVQNPNNSATPTGNSEVEEYMAKTYGNNPSYAKYIKK